MFYLFYMKNVCCHNPTEDFIRYLFHIFSSLYFSRFLFKLAVILGTPNNILVPNPPGGVTGVKKLLHLS